jgi:hypothetical protein
MPAESANILQIDGTAVTETSTVNKGGVVRHAGNVNSEVNLTNKTLGSLAGATSAHGSVVASGTDVGRAVTGAAGFGINKAEGQIRLVGNVDYDSANANRNGFTVADQSVTALRGGASDFGQRRPVHSIETIRTFHYAEAVRDGLWNEFGIGGQLNNWESAPTANTSGLWDNAANTAAGAGDDQAASNIGLPHVAQGEFTYHAGLLSAPTNDTYPAKQG